MAPADRVERYGEVVEMGAALFGSRTRMLTGLFIATLAGDRPVFCATDLRDWCAAHYGEWPNPKNDLTKFEALGMLVYEGSMDHSSRRFWRRIDTPLWDVFLMGEVAIREQIHHGAKAQRKFYVPTPEQMDRWRKDLEEIRDDLRATA